MTEPQIPDISDMARWLAVYRALETDRPDAAFRDPFARALAGERGWQIPKRLTGEDVSWFYTARTHMFDRFIVACVKNAGVDMVVNLSAGLDARPYRLSLPPTLRWVEVDLPDIIDYKEAILAGGKPACELERVRLDLSNRDARRGLFARLGGASTKALVVSEGTLIYLMSYDVRELAADVIEVPSFQQWLLDICSPGFREMMMERSGDMARAAGSPYLFSPREGPPFFDANGWKAIDVRSLLKAGRRLNRLPVFLRMMSMLPESSGAQGSRPWAGVCLLHQR
jgi:methyltransferase (TIGR00027 family)